MSGVGGRVSSSRTIADAEGASWRRLAEAIEALTGRIARSRRTSLATIVCVSLLCLLPGLATLPPIDRDEPRFAQATRQMIESGDYLDVRFQDETLYSRPIGIYWLQAVAVRLGRFGDDAPIGIYRLPSIVSAIVAACLTWWVASAFGRPRAALLAGLLLPATLLMGVEARLANAEMALLVTIVAAHGALARAWLSADTRRDIPLSLVFWGALLLSIWIKGPVGPALLVGPVVVLSIMRGSFGWLGRLSPVAGLIGTVLVVAPWLLAVGFIGHGASYGEAIGRDLFQNVGDAPQARGVPPGADLLLFLLSFWPLAAFFLAGMSSILDRLKQGPVLYATAAVIPYWLVTEAVPTTLPRVILPFFPLLAVVAADVVDRGGIRLAGSFGELGWLMRLFAAGAAIVPLAMAAAGIALALWIGAPFPFASTAIFAIALLAGVASARLFPISSVASLVVAGLAAICTQAGAFGVALPALQPARLSERLVEGARAAAVCPDPQIASAGFSEPSLVLLGGTKTQLVDGERAASFLAEGGCRVALVETGHLAPFKGRADDLGMTLTERATVNGVNINGGRPVAMHIFVGKPAK